MKTLKLFCITWLAVILPLTALAQEGSNFTGKINGTVTSDDGEPIIGATIVVKGTTHGTATSIDGDFTLDNVNEQDVLEVSSIGYKGVEIHVDGKHAFSIVLQEDTKLLDEIVVVGYGFQRKSDITGSVSSVKAAELQSAPNISTASALQGRVAGVVVQNTSGDPSGGTSIRIRGANSLTYGNDPLIIIDGVQDASIGSLNPNQIASMEVLKDAAALSVYGSKGANGVILITTKNGTSKRPTIDYNGFVTFDQVTRTLPWLNATEYATLMNKAQKENNLNPVFQDTNLGIGTNWQEQLFRNAISQNHHIGISGGVESISYYIGGNITDKQGIMINSNYKEYSLRANFKADVTDKLSLSLNTFISATDSRRGDTEGALTSALQWSPTKPVFDDNGMYTRPGGGIGPVAAYNPVGLAREITIDAKRNNINAALTGEYVFTDWLRFSSLFGYKSNSMLDGWFDNQVYNNGPSTDVAGSKGQASYTSLQSTNILTFNKELDNHLLQATAVAEYFKDTYNNTVASARGIPAGLGYQGVHFGTELQKPWSEYTATAMMSYMGRVNYSFMSKYLLSASIRNDGASQLAPGHKYDSFAAVSAGWNLLEEAFMGSLKHNIQELKLRASYGSVGNAAVPAYSSHLKFFPGIDAEGNSTLSISQLSNSSLKWERTNELNIGFDSRFWDNRLAFTTEYYEKKTTDLLMWQQVPSALGVESVLTNVGAVSNKGWEFALSGTPLSTNDFSWSINYALNFNKNRIIELDGQSDRLIQASADMPGLVGSFVQMVGQPMGTFLGYTYAGVWKQEEVSTAALYGAKPGDAKYVDYNNDGKINDDDIVIIGNAQPKFNYGINNTLNYKGFDLNIFFQGVYGNEIYNQNRIRRENYSGGSGFGTHPVMRDHWTPTNQTDVPAFSGTEYVNSSRWVEDGSYLRLKNITLGYRLPESWLNTIKLTNARLYLSGSNLLTFTNYTGYDPEASMGTDASGSAGIDRGVYPSAKSVVIGLDISF